MSQFRFIESTWDEQTMLLDDYLRNLHYPMDSYVEDHLDSATVYAISSNDNLIGFAATHKETIWFFHIRKEFVNLAQDAFESFVNDLKITSVYFQTSDTLLVSLACDWEFEKTKGAYFFIDGKQVEKPITQEQDLLFKTATLDDIPLITEKTGTFFENLKDKVEKETIFMLMKDNALLGCGIIEYGRYFKDCCSIGMIVCKEHRQKGFGKFILWNLKEYGYKKGLKPIAGCWYYNPLSKKTLEAIGMVSIARGMFAKLKEKETIKLEPMDD